MTPGNIIKFLVIGKQDTYSVRHHCDSPYKYSEADIKGMLGFLVDNICVDQVNPLAFLWALIVCSIIGRFILIFIWGKIRSETVTK
jgi:hypothetical protein